MTTLVLKDLRLALDALRPWALVVVGLAVGMLILRALPQSLDPWGLHHVSVPELFGYVAFFAGVTGVGISTWSSSAVVQGDRRHGANALAATLPSTSRARVQSKLFAVLVAALTPAFVVLGLALGS